jgi:hypothetical protein
MDYQFEAEWKQLETELAEKFEMDMDLQSTLFLIGVQELGLGFKKFSKKEKVDLMHIAICTVLEPLGHYRYSHKDKDGWPHFELLSKMPNLNSDDQELLMKRAILEYFGRQ